ncbi:MAG: hypothetical protein ACRD4S_15665 [Candidatus Acidiferrales bacterium]
MKQKQFLILAVTILLFAVAPAISSAAQETSSKTGLAPLALPQSSVILAKLVSPLDAGRCQPGDRVEAQTTADVKDGHQTLLKKGSIVSGRVIRVQTFPGSDNRSFIAAVFDSVTMKNKKESSVSLGIKALAPKPVSRNDATTDGRGMAATQMTATVAGDLSAVTVDPLSATSSGVYKLPNVELGSEMVKGVYVSVVASTLENVRLPKGTQISFSVTER